MPESEAVFVGIDVSKDHLDVAVHCEPEVRRVTNDGAGIQALVSELLELRGPTRSDTSRGDTIRHLYARAGR